jgi:hypothetical protein
MFNFVFKFFYFHFSQKTVHKHVTNVYSCSLILSWFWLLSFFRWLVSKTFCLQLFLMFSLSSLEVSSFWKWFFSNFFFFLLHLHSFCCFSLDLIIRIQVQFFFHLLACFCSFFESFLVRKPLWITPGIFVFPVRKYHL